MWIGVCLPRVCSALSVLYVLFSAIMTCFFFSVLCSFIGVGISDYYRRYALLRVTGAMIDPSGGALAADLEVRISPPFRRRSRMRDRNCAIRSHGGRSTLIL